MTSALVEFRWLSGGIAVLNAKTIFEQVPLDVIKKIIKRRRTTKRTQRTKQKCGNLTHFAVGREELAQGRSRYVTILAAPVTLNDPVILSVPHGNAGDLSGSAIPGNNRVESAVFR